MRDVDAVILPTSSIVAPLIGREQGLREPLTRFTRAFNTTGQPVVSVPVRSTGMPVGVQLVGHFGRDWELIEVAAAFERTWAPETTVVASIVARA